VAMLATALAERPSEDRALLISAAKLLEAIATDLRRLEADRG